MFSIDDHDFLYHYQNAYFKESESNIFSVANFKRYRMCLAFAFSSERHCNQTTCDILEEQLRSYCDLIDDRKGINNFAQATQEIAANLENDCKLWKSNLLKDGPKIENLLTPLSGKCYNQSSDGICTSLIPTNNDVAIFENAFEKTKTIEASPSLKQHSDKISFQNSFHKENTNDDYKMRSQNFRSNPFLKGSTSYSKVTPISKSSTSENRLFKHAQIENSPPETSHTGSGIYFHKLGKSTVPKRNKQQLDNIEDDQISKNLSLNVEFRTAGQQLRIDNKKKFGNNSRNDTSQFQNGMNSGYIKKSLGGKRSVSTKFVPPLRTNSQEERFGGYSNRNMSDGSQSLGDEELDERLKNIDPKMIDLIKGEIMDSGSKVEWEDIAGLEFAKTTIQEIVVWPMLRPDIFTGLRKPPKGILLFGPPGTGKTLIGKCIASQSNATFFSISASSLTSKWIGDGEKMVRALFAVARVHQPSVVFIDEIDSLLSQRSESEHESSRRIKTEFLVQLDGAATGEEERILVIGATNRPQELDEAARRRLVKRLYIPLPDHNARKQLVTNLMKSERNTLNSEEINTVAELTDGYSGADMKNLCQEASLGPIRSIAVTQMFEIKADQVRPVNIDDFKCALKRVRSSVSPDDIRQYLVWDKQFGFSATSLS